MRRKIHYLLFFIFILPSSLSGQNTNMKNTLVEVLTDTIILKKQWEFNKIVSRDVVSFELPPNTVKWGYYFKQIDKEKTTTALSNNYFVLSDFKKDTINQKQKKLKQVKFRRVGPVRVETLLLNNKGKMEFLKIKNEYCLTKRPEGYFKDESVLCETGNCHTSKKVISQKPLNGKHYIGFRNIDFRKDGYFVIQIVAYVN